MKELRLTEYTEGHTLWLPKGARILAVREQPSMRGNYVWTVLENASPTEKTLRRLLVAEVNDVCRVNSNERLAYIGAIGSGEDARTVFEVVRLPEIKQMTSAVSYSNVNV